MYLLLASRAPQKTCRPTGFLGSSSSQLPVFVQLYSMSGFLTFLIVLLSRVCLSEHPFLYDITGGSLKISLSKSCCCTKCTAHKYFYRVWNFRIVLWYYKGQDSIVCFSLLEGSFTLLKFHF